MEKIILNYVSPLFTYLPTEVLIFQFHPPSVCDDRQETDDGREANRDSEKERGDQEESLKKGMQDQRIMEKF